MKFSFRIFKKKAFIQMMIVLTLTACASMPPKAPVDLKKGDYAYAKAYMYWFIEREMKDNNIVGLSIALVDDQSIVWQQGFGFADKKKNVKATPETVYRAGSISKLFNAMAVMKLVEASKIDIDRPLAKYLPEFKVKSRFGSTDGITPRTIMTHHSGLPSDWWDGHYGKHPMPFTQLVHAIKDEYVAYPPNMIMSYSNLAVSLLGHGVQKVSGKDFVQFMDQDILTPMGMKHSRFEAGITGNKASKSYKDGKEVVEYPLGDIPAGGLDTTVIDLARLAMLVNNRGNIDGRQILKPGTLNTMMTAQNKNIPLDCGFRIGLAWFIDNTILAGKEPVFSHDGGVIAHCSSFMVAPKSKLGVVVLANTASADPGKIAKKLLQKAWEAKNCQRLPKIPSHDHGPSDFSGTYATMMGKVNIAHKTGNQYKIESSVGNFNLNLEDDHQYHLSYLLLGFIPIDLDELGEVDLSTEDISGYHAIIAELDRYRILAGVKVNRKPIHEAWKSRLGTYRLVNPPPTAAFNLKKFEINIEDGYLVEAFTFPKHTFTQILRTVNDHEAITEGLGRDMGETVRVINSEKGEILTYAGLRFERIKE
jgi:CubicO group peptidase (beta-lactamase class C family)